MDATIDAPTQTTGPDASEPVVKQRRTCADRSRYIALVDLREWKQSLLSSENYGQQRKLISSRPELSYFRWSGGWTTWVTMRFPDGYEILMHSGKYGDLKWSPGYEISVGLRLYKELSKRIRKSA